MKKIGGSSRPGIRRINGQRPDRTQYIVNATPEPPEVKEEVKPKEEKEKKLNIDKVHKILPKPQWRRRSFKAKENNDDGQMDSSN